MTEWNGNDGAPWVALTLTTFDATISPVATLSDIGDSGLGIFLKLDGTSVMAGTLNMDSNDLLNVTNVIGDSSLKLQDSNGQRILLQPGTDTLHYAQNATTILMRVGFTRVVIEGTLEVNGTLDMDGNSIDMGDGDIVDVDRVASGTGSNLAIETRAGGSMTLGAPSGTNYLYVDFEQSIFTQTLELRLGGHISGYDPSPPLYGGGDTFWYQQRNIRFKDTPGAPSDSEGQDGDVCLMYTF